MDTWPPVTVAETHSAAVVFFGDRAYKVKKPVDLGFLDFRSREVRERICHQEVELNRRLAPDVYLGVADVHGPDGEVCDHLVVMRRMPADRRLSTLVEQGADVGSDLWHLAHLLAAFHARSPRSSAADEAAGVDATARRWAANTAEMRALPAFEPAVLDRIQRLADRYLTGRAPLFEQRVADGRAVDGHGDLQAGDIFCLDDGPRVLDCLEFDERLRHGDALADVAFLAMDLARLGRPDLAEQFLDAYQEHAADTWPRSLAHHQIAYRAQVRAKVAAIRAAQGDGEAAAAIDRYLSIILRHLEAARVRIVVVGGLPGTGKSTLARGIGEALGATVLRSDEVRKEQAGRRTDEPAPAGFEEGLYAADRTEATYRTLLDRAATATSLGETVVLDASWTDARWRQEARAAAFAAHADLVELRCEVAPDIAAERMQQRARRGGDPSDATPAVAAAMARRAEPWPEAITVDTSEHPDASLATALGRVGEI